MHRTDADGNASNLYTDGNPSLGVPATAIEQHSLNAFQEELCNVVEMNGTALVKDLNTQVRAIIAQILSGMTPGGRLTLTTAVPVTTTDVTGATTVYYTPYKSARVPLYNGTVWAAYTFTELSQALSDTTKSPAAATTNSNYDVFVWNDSGTLRATRGPAWSSDTARGTGAGTTELELYDGRYVNKVAITNGPAARRGLYVGTFRTDGSTQVNDSLAKRHVWNAHNRVRRAMRVTEATDTWTYTTAAFRQANASASNQLDFVIGLSEDVVHAEVLAIAKNTTVGTDVVAAIGLDSTTAMASGCLTILGDIAVTGLNQALVAKWRDAPGLGRHYLAWLEYSEATGTTTFSGDAGLPTRIQSGIMGELLG